MHSKDSEKGNKKSLKLSKRSTRFENTKKIKFNKNGILLLEKFWRCLEEGQTIPTINKQRVLKKRYLVS